MLALRSDFCYNRPIPIERSGSVKKRIIWIAVILVAVLAAGAGGCLLYNQYIESHYIDIDEIRYERSVEELDFSGGAVPDLEKITELTALKRLDLRDTGLTVEAYEMLRQALPGCQVLWSVPFQGGFVSEDITVLDVTELSAEDLQMLKYLPGLTAVDATGCRDYEVLMDLCQQRPDLNVIYQVQLGGEVYASDVAELTLENADVEELKRMMPYMTGVEQITFTGVAPSNDAIYSLVQQYPDTTFVWDFEVCGVQTNSLAEKLILSGIPMESVEAVEESLKYFYNLTWVEMCDCGIASTEMDALWKRHPETRFVWSVQVGMCKLRTDIVTFMPFKFGYDGFLDLMDEDMGEIIYCVDLVCLDMGHMGITDYSFLRYLPKLKYLILADTHGTDFSALAELKELVFLELFMTQFDQAEVLTGLTNLEDLNLGNSQIDNVEPFKQMTWLKRLWLPAARKVWGEERQALIEALPDTIVNFQGAGSTEGGWRESPNYYAMRDLLEMGYLGEYSPS